MARSKRLQPVQKLATDKANRAAQSFSSASSRLREEQAKLEQLKTYRQEYVQMLQARTEQGVAGSQLRQWHQFLTRIDKALTSQQELVVQCQLQVNQMRQNWQEQHRHAKAIGKAMSRLQTQENRVRAKKEAKQLDEISTQSFLRNRFNKG